MSLTSRVGLLTITENGLPQLPFAHWMDSWVTLITTWTILESSLPVLGLFNFNFTWRWIKSLKGSKMSRWIKIRRRKITLLAYLYVSLLWSPLSSRDYFPHSATLSKAKGGPSIFWFCQKMHLMGKQFCDRCRVLKDGWQRMDGNESGGCAWILFGNLLRIALRGSIIAITDLLFQGRACRTVKYLNSLNKGNNKILWWFLGSCFVTSSSCN